MLVLAVYDMSRLMNTGLDMETLTRCVKLCETGVNPEALATCIKEIRRETAAARVRFEATSHVLEFLININVWHMLSCRKPSQQCRQLASTECFLYMDT